MKRKAARTWPVSIFAARFQHLVRERGRQLGYRKMGTIKLPDYRDLEAIMAQGDADKVASSLCGALEKALIPADKGRVPSHMDVMMKFVEENRELIAEVTLTYVPEPQPAPRRRFP